MQNLLFSTVFWHTDTQKKLIYWDKIWKIYSELCSEIAIISQKQSLELTAKYFPHNNFIYINYWKYLQIF